MVDTAFGDSYEDLVQAGRTARKRLPHALAGQFTPPERDPIAILEHQHVNRLPNLVPVRIGRMAQSPFAFYRGSAAIMANDLALEPNTGANIVICGDAHLSNFGHYATPERALTFELNDFDEGCWGPWEWDVKRLAASIMLASQDAGHRPGQAADATFDAVRLYQQTLRRLMKLSALERFHYQPNLSPLQKVLDSKRYREMVKVQKKARRRTSDQVLKRIATDDLRIREQPPIMVHRDDFPVSHAEELFMEYMRTARTDVAFLLEQYRIRDMVLRVVGVGSVGTRCSIVLLTGPAGEPLFLQVKEAEPSVVITHGKIAAASRVHRLEDEGEGYRVVGVQRILQSQSDPFLGYFSHGDRHYYVRQFRDMKGSYDIAAMDASTLAIYAQVCAGLLARAHVQSPNAAFILGYLGKGSGFARAMVNWAEAYGDQALRDYGALVAAIDSGRLPAEYDI